MAVKAYAFKHEDAQELCGVLKNIEAAAQVACEQFTKALTAITGTDEYLKDCVTKDTIIEGSQPLVEAVNKLNEDMAKMSKLVSGAAEQWHIQVSSVVKKTANVSSDLATISKKVKERQ